MARKEMEIYLVCGEGHSSWDRSKMQKHVAHKAGAEQDDWELGSEMRSLDSLSSGDAPTHPRARLASANPSDVKEAWERALEDDHDMRFFWESKMEKSCARVQCTQGVVVNTCVAERRKTLCDWKGWVPEPSASSSTKHSGAEEHEKHHLRLAREATVNVLTTDTYTNAPRLFAEHNC